MMDDIEVISQRVRDMKSYYSTRDAETVRLRALRSGQWELLAPGAFTEDYPAPMVANRVDVMARDTAASLAQMPSISCAAAGGVSEKQKKFCMAQTAMDHSKMDMSQTAPSMTEGEVKKVDLEAGKVTIKHGVIKHLDMPGMTMVFTAKDKGLLNNVKPGEKVQFMVVNEGGKMLLIAINSSN